MDEVIQMVLQGEMAELIVKAAPKIYRKYARTSKKGEKVLYVVLQKVLHSCL